MKLKPCLKKHHKQPKNTLPWLSTDAAAECITIALREHLSRRAKKSHPAPNVNTWVLSSYWSQANKVQDFTYTISILKLHMNYCITFTSIYTRWYTEKSHSALNNKISYSHDHSYLVPRGRCPQPLELAYCPPTPAPDREHRGWRGR